MQEEAGLGAGMGAASIACNGSFPLLLLEPISLLLYAGSVTARGQLRLTARLPRDSWVIGYVLYVLLVGSALLLVPRRRPPLGSEFGALSSPLPRSCLAVCTVPYRSFGPPGPCCIFVLCALVHDR